MWLAAGNVYAATLLQSSFWATFHTLLPSIIVAIARSLLHSELCLLHALCYANMSATLFACRPSNVNHMFTPNASRASFLVRVENQSAIPGVITISFFFLEDTQEFYEAEMHWWCNSFSRPCWPFVMHSFPRRLRTYFRDQRIFYFNLALLPTFKKKKNY